MCANALTRGEVMFREVDELPNDGKVIDDLRKLE